MHRDLAAGRWAALTLTEQLGNAGAEVGRALRAQASGDARRLEPALDRALELLDLTITDRRWTGPQRREVARAREVVCDFFFGANAYASTAASLEAYFMAFALAARRTR